MPESEDPAFSGRRCCLQNLGKEAPHVKCSDRFVVCAPHAHSQYTEVFG